VKKYYLERGIPYRRGYLLHGPPGTGKSSLITAIAGEIKMNVYVINLGSKSLTDELLIDVMSEAPSRCILLLEDIDACLETSESAKLTLSGLLNAIDGIVAQQGRILFMTTNTIEKLPPALIRPGRIDLRLFLGYAKKIQLKRLFLKFYPDELLAEQFSNKIPENTISMANLQGYLIKYKNDPRSAVENADEVIKEQHSQYTIESQGLQI